LLLLWQISNRTTSNNPSSGSIIINTELHIKNFTVNQIPLF